MTRPERALALARGCEHAAEDPAPAPPNTGAIVTFSVEMFTKRKPGEDQDRDGDGKPDHPGWAEWCAGFAWRCELESGQDLNLHERPWEFLSCTSSWARVQTLPGYTLPEPHEIAPGDLVWFGPEGKDTLSHMGRVHRTDPAAGVFWSIEGNAGEGARQVAIVRHHLSEPGHVRRFARGPA